MSVDWQTQILSAFEHRDSIEKANDDFFKAFDLSARRVQDLEIKLDTLQKTDLQMELTNSLSKVTELSAEKEKLNQTVLAEQEKSDILLKEVAELKRNLGILREGYNTIDKKLKTLKEESLHKAQNLESINDEILTLQIENNLLNTKNQELRKENDQLIKRWLDKVEKDAQLFNDVIKSNENKH